MNYEVEQKFPVADLGDVEAKLNGLGAEVAQPRTEADVYYAHPARDFAATDEALRIRRRGPSNYITYKGPKIDATTKTRQEIELGLTPGDEAAAQWAELLEVLGFRPVGEVRKRRRKAAVAWQGRQVEASLDDVDRVGTFVELELITDADALESAKACIASLAERLGLSATERRSYLTLLLESEAK